MKQADFRQIEVNSLGGNDVIRIDYGAQVQPPTIVDTGDGNDTAFGGSGHAMFRTSNGNSW